MARAWVNTKATRFIMRAYHPMNTKRSPRVLDSAYLNTRQMMRGQEDERSGSVNAFESGDVT
jgi:hypothetical protein